MKIMLDECLAVGPATQIINFGKSANPDIQVTFLLDYLGQEQGVKDQTWVSRISEEGDWFVITADFDKRKTGKKRTVDGPPLHTILPGKLISAVYLSGNIQSAPGHEKARAVISLWPDIIRFFKTGVRGAKMIVRRQTKGLGFHLRRPTQ